MRHRPLSAAAVLQHEAARRRQPRGQRFALVWAPRYGVAADGAIVHAALVDGDHIVERSLCGVPCPGWRVRGVRQGSIAHQRVTCSHCASAIAAIIWPRALPEPKDREPRQPRPSGGQPTGEP